MQLLGVIAAFWFIAMDAPRAISLGPITLAGALTLATACIGLTQLLFLPLMSRVRAVPTVALLWFVFICLVIASGLSSFTTGTTYPAAIQNVSVYVSFVAIACVCATGDGDANWRRLRIAAAVVAYAVPLNSGLALGLISDRPSSIAAILAMAVLLPGRPENVVIRLAPYAAAIGCLLTLSRTSTVVAALLLTMAVLRGRSGWRAARALGVLGLAIAAIAFLVTQYPPFRDRFLIGDNALQINGLALSTQGRLSFWEAILTNFKPEEVFGQGAGAAEFLISQTSPGQTHPHNDYLRLMYDFGVGGVALFVLPIVILAWAALKQARKDDEPAHWAAVIASAAILAVAFTDNPFVYIFVMAPFGFLHAVSASKRGGR